MMRLDLVMMCVFAVIFLLRVVGLLKEWMAPAAQPRRMHVAKFYPSRKPAELIVIPVNPPKRAFPPKVGERIALLQLVAVAMATALRIG